jgi:hypothetical protein
MGHCGESNFERAIILKLIIHYLVTKEDLRHSCASGILNEKSSKKAVSSSLEAISFAETDAALDVFDQLVKIFRERTRPVNAKRFPNYSNLCGSNA